ncbi:MAG: iron-sulfur protein [Gemmatimonas sp.]|nr:iron-sulfur protein [Gemmatimonas sp.]
MIARREFVTRCSAAAAALAFGGCGSLVVHTVPAPQGRVSLALADFPELAREGGVLSLLPEAESDPIFVLALGAGAFAALSSQCTHRGCTLDAEATRLVCPCHGSAFGRDGAVLRGPAQHPLPRYHAAVADGRLLIDLRRSA